MVRAFGFDLNISWMMRASGSESGSFWKSGEVVEGGGLQALGAGEDPLGFGELFDEGGLVEVGGFVLFAEFGEELVEFVLVFVGEDGEGGGESVFGGVAGGGGFAFGGFGAGGVLGVLLIREDLRGGSHGVCVS